MKRPVSHAIQWVTPLPPLRTGISRYSLDLLNAVDGRWDVGAVIEEGSKLGTFSTVRAVSLRQLDGHAPLVIQIGNSDFHRMAFQLGLERRGILVLHDIVLHHALLAEAIRRGNAREYWRELQVRYGAAGYQAGRELLRGRTLDDLGRYPLSERYIENAKLTLVHSRHAQELALRYCPDANVERIPMGVPIPASISREAARSALGLPQSSFIAASITHVNPNKRIPIVLRAMRKLVARMPEARLILAGTNSDGPEVGREISQLGLERYVSVWGFIDEPKARLLAAASDACVNLRHPSTGETSASLLRLLAAGRPVLITDGDASAEFPAGIGLPVALDRCEAEMVAEILWSLAIDDELREASGRLARHYVIEKHGMGAAVDGYRRAIERAYGVSLPGLDDEHVMEPDVGFKASKSRHWNMAASPIAERVGGAVADLGLGGQEATIRTAATAIVELGLDRVRNDELGLSAGIADRLAGRLACPSCRQPLASGDGAVYCQRCGMSYGIRGGIPRFIAAMPGEKSNK